MNVGNFALIVAIAGLLFLWRAIDVHYKKYLVKLHAGVLPHAIGGLPFVHSWYIGKDRHAVAGDEERTFWADATYSVLILHRGKPAAVLGFELSKEALIVCQLQGLKGAYVGDIELGIFLLRCAERIARALSKAVIRVQPACRHAYFDLDEEHRLYPQLYAHQARLRRMYDASSQELGYMYHRPGYFFWHEKRLQKRITFQRYLRLHLLLFNRQARARYSVSPTEPFTTTD